MRHAGAQLPYLPRALNLIWQSAPGWALIWIILLLLQGLLPALTISLTRLLVDQMASILQNRPALESTLPAGMQMILLLAGGLAGALLLSQLIQGAMNWIHTVLSEQVGLYVSSLIHTKAIQADYSFYESSNKYDHLYRARIEATYRPVAVLDHLGMIAQSSITLVTIVALLLPYGVWLPLVLLVTSLPTLVMALYFQERQHAFEKRVSDQQRRFWYYDSLLTTPESAAEMRLFGLGPFFMRAHQSVRQKITRERLHIERNQFIGQLLVSLVSLAAAGACMAYMIWRALQGMATFGDLALFYQVFSQGQSVLRNFLNSAGQFYGSLLFLSNLFEFLDLKNEMVETAHPTQPPDASRGGTLCFENVTFGYLGSSSPVINGFHLTLPAGKITAIVGDNGAGKSTLLKLLCRLYDPQAGRICWDGVDLREIRQEDLRTRITVLFQTPMSYQSTASENIGYSALDRAGLDDIIQASQAAGADAFIQNLPQGYQTQLGKLFEKGTNLSGGQWQRISLARAFLRKSPLMLLDEPTSAMDAWAENEWLERLRGLCAGRTTLLITHRLTTAIQADVIHVMVNGEIVESGSHDELLARNGRYAQAWYDQVRMNPAEGR